LSWLPDGYQKSKSRNVGKCWRLPELPRLPTKLSYIEKKNSKMAIRLMLMRSFSFFLSKFLVKNGNPLNADAEF